MRQRVDSPEPAPLCGRVLKTIAQLEGDLEVVDIAIFDIATHIGHLKPIEVPKRLGPASDAIANGAIYPLLRRPDYLNKTICSISHQSPLPSVSPDMC